MPGFEPGASCSQSRRANQAAPHPVKPAESYLVRSRRLSIAARLGRCPGCRWPRPRRTTSALGNPGGGETVRYAKAGEPPRGRSSMVEPQPSKLVMRVRFPSPAPRTSPGQRTFAGLARRLIRGWVRATYVPRADGLTRHARGILAAPPAFPRAPAVSRGPALQGGAASRRRAPGATRSASALARPGGRTGLAEAAPADGTLARHSDQRR
jgi:hypothetical protein